MEIENEKSQDENAVKQRNYNEGGITGKGFKKGQSGNPKGRPKGKTIKERVREWLEEHPDDMEKFVEHFVRNNKELAWQMMEGRPPATIDLTGDVKTEHLHKLEKTTADILENLYEFRSRKSLNTKQIQE